ncbi:CheF family chemotaxis protein [Methanocaldococcus indicus]|uniref:CheF family chemotaxis protein n=1 Tax=Methanocaldococcus indicus TaxID=213231 RepID=UPI003C6D1779
MMSKVITKFSGKGILLNQYTLKNPALKWEKLEIILYDDSIEFIFPNKKMRIKLEYIEDIGVELPRKAIEIAKSALEDITYHSSIIFNPPEMEKTMVGFAPETSMYGRKPLDAFLSKLFYVLLHKKPVKIQYAAMKGGSLDPNAKWEDGQLYFIQKKSSVGGSKEILVVVVFEEEKPKVYNVFTNIEAMRLKEKVIDGETVEALEIKQVKNNESITSYLYTDNKTRLFILRYLANLTKYKHAVKDLLPKSEDEIISEFAAEAFSGEKIKSEIEKLKPEEQEILVALYTGISSLELPTMLGMDVDEVERILDDLIDKGLLRLVRVRKEVELSEKGRAITNYLVSNF